MTEQMNLFPSASGVIDVRGDVASIKYNVLWTVERLKDGSWNPCKLSHRTRKGARAHAKYIRERENIDARVVPYKACVDSKGRHNRQVISERLDR